MLDRIPFTSKEDIFAKLAELAEIGAFSPEERDMYETSLAVLRDNMAVLKQERIDGREEKTLKMLQK